MGERDWITYPVPLDGGFVAKLRLPEDLSRAEAEKIARIVLTLFYEASSDGA